MASFVTMNLNSDDESDDDDFVPDGLKGSDDSGSDTEVKKSSKVKKSKAAHGRKGGIFIEENSEENGSDSRKEEFEQEKIEKKELENEKKVDDLWATFKKDTSVKSKTNSSNQTKSKQTYGGLGSFTSLDNNRKKKNKSNSIKKNKNRDIMSSIFDSFSKTKNENPEDKEFNTASTLTNSNENVPKSIVSSIFESTDQLPKQSEDRNSHKDANESSAPTDSNKVVITKTYDFAGESVLVSKEVDKDSKEGKKYLKSENNSETSQSEHINNAPKRSSGGLSSIMGVISGKKPKLGCLDKSKMDWNKYVAEEGIKEELETFNKGKDGYVEKQMFLDRADYRRFEIEKEAREKTRKPLNK